MHQQQTLTPADAYGALQLRPSAPHDLIERAYWALVSGPKQRANGEDPFRLGRLNDAYATLISPERRAAYDTEHGHERARSRPTVTVRRRGLFSRRTDVSTRLTHYELLHVDPGASAEVIDAAYGFRCTKLMGGDIRFALERRLIDEAYAVLSDPQRRAHYDEKLSPRFAQPPVAPPAEPAPAASSPARTIAAPSGLEAPRVPETSALTAVSQTAHGVDVAPGPPAAAPERTAISAPRRWPAFLRRSQERREADRTESRRVVEAEQQRLRQLGMAGDTPFLPDELGEPSDAFVPAFFRFVEGPQAGQVVELSNGSLIFGGSESADVVLQNPDGMIGAGHVRVWHRENDFLLHQLDTFSTTFVNGERLDLRIVILEPRDEVRIGPHILVFERDAEVPAPAPAAEAAPAGETR